MKPGQTSYQETKGKVAEIANTLEKVENTATIPTIKNEEKPTELVAVNSMMIDKSNTKTEIVVPAKNIISATPKKKIVQPKVATNKKSSWMKPGQTSYQETHGISEEAPQTMDKPLAKKQEVVNPVAIIESLNVEKNKILLEEQNIAKNVVINPAKKEMEAPLKKVKQPKVVVNKKSTFQETTQTTSANIETKIAENPKSTKEPVSSKQNIAVKPSAGIATNIAEKTKEIVVTEPKTKDILKSKNIEQIEAFLKTAHPEDPRRIVLRNKLVNLKNSSWMKAGQSNYAITKNYTAQNPTIAIQQNFVDETDEFKKLMAENPAKHQDKTVKLLNQLFDNDVMGKDAILLVQNKSNCNMIVRIKGADFYNLAIPAQGENFVVIKKGDYQLSSNMCEAKYFAAKKVVKNMLISLMN